MPTTLVLFDRDLRLADHAPLYHAGQRGAVVPVLVWSPEDEGDWPMGAAQRAWLARSLVAFDASLHAHGARLTVRRGPTADAVAALLDETGADAVYWHRRYSPAGRALDDALRALCAGRGVEAEAFDGVLLHDPDQVQTGAGGPYQVYGPFWKAFVQRVNVLPPLPAPQALPTPSVWPEERLSVAALATALRPTLGWDAGFWDVWTPGERGAHDRLQAFVEADRALAPGNDPWGDVLGLDRYAKQRGRPDVDGSSRLSPHLALGEVSIRTVWHAAQGEGWSREKFRKELAWREFAYHLLWHFPASASEPMRPAFGGLPWRDAPADRRAWQRGRTGYPYLDAGLRQLWTTGWMHNRVRMAVGGFLVKQLLLPWQDGARWFWDTLVDADLANNTLGWQWVTGSGVDSAPYVRLLNPVLQGQKFDPDGHYVRAFVPELRSLPGGALHTPWDAPAETLAAAGLTLGDTYPHRLVEHAAARRRALDAYESIRATPSTPPPLA